MFRYLALLLCYSLLGAACHTAGGETEKGKQLSLRYCGSCHLPVSPALLDKTTWLKHVLPAMAPGLGINVWQEDQYFPAADSSKAGIPFNDWLELVKYYGQMAPDSLAPAKDRPPLRESWGPFALRAPVWTDTAKTALTTMVAIDPYNGTLYSASQNEGNSLYQWSRGLQPKELQQLQSPAVDMRWHDSASALLTCIGAMRAVDAPMGSVLAIRPAAAPDQQLKTIGLGLPRPVQALPADFNKDGRTDYLVCGFGHNYGGLYILQQTPDEDYKKLPLREQPGAIHAITGDFDEDGWPDIMALFAYDDEGIWLFLNDHKGGFRERNLLRFPPVYGSTGFTLADFNGDGIQDILYTCGDNGDYSMVLKPYHGMYLYLGQGGFRYRQEAFYPVNGCTKALAADFDGDGDLDITSIAFFADLQHRPGEGCIYWEQAAPLRFVPHAVPVYGKGRWICMDAGDVDGDGDLDVALGNYARGFHIQDQPVPGWSRFLPLIVLENRTK